MRNHMRDFSFMTDRIETLNELQERNSSEGFFSQELVNKLNELYKTRDKIVEKALFTEMFDKMMDEYENNKD